MGIKQAPAFYNEFISKILPKNNVLHYFDDIYIYHDERAPLDDVIQNVRHILTEYNIIINEEKTQDTDMYPKRLLGMNIYPSSWCITLKKREDLFEKCITLPWERFELL